MEKPSFYIELYNPSRSYLAGQVVEGRVVIENEKEEDVNEISILLDGSANVHWTETERYTEPTSRMGDGKFETVDESKTRTVHYDANETYISQKLYLVGDGHNYLKLPPGFFAYPFQFVLPTNIPSSFTSDFGSVSYILKAKMKRPFLKWNRRDTVPFTVNGIYDLNTEPAALQPQEKRRQKGSNCCACRKGQIFLVCKLPRRSGFVPGEIIDFNCEVTNSSNKKVKDIKATLYQHSTFYAKGKRNFRRRTIRELHGPEVGIGDNEMWIPNSFVIPPIPPTRLGGTCRIIDVEYELKLKITISGLTTSMTAEFPVLIGTIPLRSTFDEIRQFPSIPPNTYPMPDANNDPKLGNMGFVSPSPSYIPVTPVGSSSSSQANAVPSAPFFPEYPDLPPPTYAEAQAVAGFTCNQKYSSNEKNEKMTRPSDEDGTFDRFYSEFVPNYVTYRVPEKEKA